MFADLLDLLRYYLAITFMLPLVLYRVAQSSAATDVKLMLQLALVVEHIHYQFHWLKALVVGGILWFLDTSPAFRLVLQRLAARWLPLPAHVRPPSQGG